MSFLLKLKGYTPDKRQTSAIRIYFNNIVVHIRKNTSISWVLFVSQTWKTFCFCQYFIFFILFHSLGGGFSLWSVPVLASVQSDERHNRPVCTSSKFLSTDRKRRRVVSKIFADFRMFYEHSASCFYTVWPWEFVKTACAMLVKQENQYVLDTTLLCFRLFYILYFFIDFRL